MPFPDLSYQSYPSLLKLFNDAIDTRREEYLQWLPVAASATSQMLCCHM